VFHGILNAYWEPLQFQLPPSPSAHREDWRRCIDTALPSPEDIQPWKDAPVLKETTYLVQPRSVVLLALALDKGAESR
jgi:isoamylase